MYNLNIKKITKRKNGKQKTKNYTSEGQIDILVELQDQNSSLKKVPYTYFSKFNYLVTHVQVYSNLKVRS